MDKVANDFINYLSEHNVPPSEFKKLRMTAVKQSELPFSCRYLGSVISSTVHEFYIHEDNATRFNAIVDAKEFKDDANGLHDLLTFMGKCLLEEVCD